MKLSLLLLSFIGLLFALSTVQYELPSKASNPEVIDTDLPIVSITLDSLSISRKRPGWFEIISSDPLKQMGPYPISAIQSGDSSIVLPKKRISFKFSHVEDWTKGKKRRVLGLSKNDDWILDSSPRDALVFRNIFNHRLYNMIRGKKETINGFLSEVYINGRYEGLYVLSERIDKNFLKLESSPYHNSLWAKVYKYFRSMSDKSKIYQVHRFHRMIYRSMEKIEKKFGKKRMLKTVLYKSGTEGDGRAGGDMKLKNPVMQGMLQKYPHSKYLSKTSNLEDFLLFVNNSSVEEFKTDIWDKLDRDATLDYVIFLLVNTGFDNMHKNYYFLFQNGKFKFLPWDFDETLMPHIPHTSWLFPKNGLLKRLMRGDDPHFLLELSKRWKSLRQGVLTKESINELFDDLYLKAKSSGALERNDKRWNGGKKQGKLESDLSVTRIREWIDRRLYFIDDRILNTSFFEIGL